MYGYSVSEVKQTDSIALSKVDSLLEKEGIRRDKNLDYTVAVYDEAMNMVATGSMFENTLRCFAVSSEHQGEGLLRLVMDYLLNAQIQKGFTHSFLYTKPQSAKFFKDFWFSEIATVDNSVTFMENRKNGFSTFLEKLSIEKSSNEICGCIVMNANPFTNGHKYLVEKALDNCDVLHVFVLNEDRSLIPFEVRYKLVKEGLKGLKNVSIHQSGPYIISNATFPSYFLKDEDSAVVSHAKLDVQVFKQIAKALNITKRFVGTEPYSSVTNIYNSVLKEELPKAEIELIEIPRLENNGAFISASKVRQLIKDGRTDSLKEIVPYSTYRFFKSKEADTIIEKIKNASDVIHH